MPRFAVLDYGMGNLRSVQKALERVGASPIVTREAESASEADGVVLPGVGAFPAAMRRVSEQGFDELVRVRCERGAPVLGICLGLQLLFERSSEHGGAEGIGVLAGDVGPLDSRGLKLPHIGWEPVRWERDSGLVDGIESGTPFYFVHSFTVRPLEMVDVLGTAEHGSRFVCAVARPPLYGAQFHPEKSSAAGLRLLANFVEICARVTA